MTFTPLERASIRPAADAVPIAMGSLRQASQVAADGDAVGGERRAVGDVERPAGTRRVDADRAADGSQRDVAVRRTERPGVDQRADRAQHDVAGRGRPGDAERA